MADEDVDALVAEYVLGTLSAVERDDVERRAAQDAALAARIAYWERRLGTLEEMVEPVEPPAAVWNGIRARIADVEPDVDVRLPDLPGPPAPSGAVVGNVTVLSRRVRRWRGIAALAALAAAALLIIGGIERYSPELLPPELRRPVETKVVEKEVEKVVERVVEVTQPAPGRLVAVLQRDPGGPPAFLLTVDAANRTLTVRRVTPAEEGKSHELWLVSNKFPAPRSLGVISADEFTQGDALATYDADTVSQATFAVSLEPEGGSPTGAPTGPMLFTGKLLEAVPPRR